MASIRVPAWRCPSETLPVTSCQEDDMKRRSSPITPKDGPTNRSKWKCHAPLFCIPILQKPAKSPNFLCKRLRNPSCPLQALDGEGQQEAYDLKLEASGRDCMNLPGKHRTQLAEDRFDVLAGGLAQELLPCRHRPLRILLALGFQVQTDLF